MAITDEFLREKAREALALASNANLSLTEAVAKVASHPEFTHEHVRRLCEVTYHERYLHDFQKKASSKDPDRYVSFDPPRSEDVLLLLGKRASEKTASYRGTGTHGVTVEKTASAGIPEVPRFKQVDAFSEYVQKFGFAEKIAWADPLKELRDAELALREELQLLRGDFQVKVAQFDEDMTSLLGMAVRLRQRGEPEDRILAVALSATSVSPAVEDIAEKVASAIVSTPIAPFAGREDSGDGQPNPKHPLAILFSKCASQVQEIIQMEHRVQDLQRTWTTARTALNRMSNHA